VFVSIGKSEFTVSIALAEAFVLIGTSAAIVLSARPEDARIASCFWFQLKIRMGTVFADSVMITLDEARSSTKTVQLYLYRFD